MRFAYWNPQGLTYMFLAEAKRLWELQVATGCNEKLTSVQAVFLINAVINNCGLDKLGKLYGLQGVSLRKRWTFLTAMLIFVRSVCGTQATSQRGRCLTWTASWPGISFGNQSYVHQASIFQTRCHKRLGTGRCG